jgi:hypothetical protein
VVTLSLLVTHLKKVCDPSRAQDELNALVLAAKRWSTGRESYLAEVIARSMAVDEVDVLTRIFQ